MCARVAQVAQLDQELASMCLADPWCTCSHSKATPQPKGVPKVHELVWRHFDEVLLRAMESVCRERQRSLQACCASRCASRCVQKLASCSVFVDKPHNRVVFLTHEEDQCFTDASLLHVYDVQQLWQTSEEADVHRVKARSQPWSREWCCAVMQCMVLYICLACHGLANACGRAGSCVAREARSMWTSACLPWSIPNRSCARPETSLAQDAALVPGPDWSSTLIPTATATAALSHPVSCDHL